MFCPTTLRTGMLNLVSQDKPAQQEADFATFWLLYPRRVAKRDAEKAWSKMTPAERFDSVVALVDWIKVWRARGDLEFVPYPATWLNGARWEDELPTEMSCRPAAQTAFKSRDNEPRGEIPDSVKAAIAKVLKR